jgi:hypothetical protein
MLSQAPIAARDARGRGEASRGGPCHPSGPTSGQPLSQASIAVRDARGRGEASRGGPCHPSGPTSGQPLSQASIAVRDASPLLWEIHATHPYPFPQLDGIQDEGSMFFTKPGGMRSVRCVFHSR